MLKMNLSARILDLAILLFVVPIGWGKPAAGQESPPPGHHLVEEVKLLRRGGGRVDWSVQGNLVAFDARGDEGRYELRVIGADGEGERCLTCERPELYRGQALNPVWHPSGELIVFQLQRPADALKLTPVDLATPRRGMHSTLWAVSVDGNRFWPLFAGQTGDYPMLDPHFSHEADLLVWAERVASREGRWGHWGLRVARFAWDEAPRTSDIRLLEPIRGLLIPQGFTPDDQAVLVTTLGEESKAPSLQRLELDGGTLGSGPGLRLVRGAPVRISPGGDWLVWTTGHSLARRAGTPRLPSRNELWRMPIEGGEAERLTYFNDPMSSTHLGDALIDDIAWHPEGDRLLVHVILDRLGELEERIVLLAFNEPM